MTIVFNIDRTKDYGLRGMEKFLHLYVLLLFPNKI